MNDRYTSPALSRDLAEAGLEQRVREYGAYYVMGSLRETQFSVSVGPASFAFRALDLTDVLHEMTRPRPEEKDARPLVRAYQIWYDTEDSNTPRFRYWDADGLGKPQVEHRIVVEAAATVLLALLRERRKP